MEIDREKKEARFAVKKGGTFDLDAVKKVLKEAGFTVTTDKVHEVTVVKAGDGKITMTMKGDDKKHTHDVAKDAVITLDGKTATLKELKEGFPAKVTLDDKFVVHKIEAQKVIEATIVKAGDGKITLTFKGADQKHNHDVTKDAKITLDDKKAKLEELKEGFTTKVMMDDKFDITMIEAKSKK